METKSKQQVLENKKKRAKYHQNKATKLTE